MSLLDDIKTQLQADSVDSGTWEIFLGYEPDAPDTSITIYETGGPDPDQTDVATHDFPTFQVRVRGGEFGYQAARTKIQEVFNSLNNVDISGYVYIFATNSGPIPLGFDKQANRPVLVWNFKTMKVRV